MGHGSFVGEGNERRPYGAAFCAAQNLTLYNIGWP